MNELKVIYLKEADEFIASLPQKDRMKVFYNVDQVMGETGVKDCSGSWKVQKYGNSERIITETHTDYWHFGTGKKGRWW